MIKDDYQCDPRELGPYMYPKRRDLKKLKCQSVCLGSYIPWDVKANTKLIEDELGWCGDQVEGMPWEEYSYEKIECSMQGMRDYIKYLKPKRDETPMRMIAIPPKTVARLSVK